jgi:hypothetical protein
MLRMPMRSRNLPQSLSAAERRVLEAFFRGRLPAGGLSEALADARRLEPHIAAAAPQAVPAFRLAT